MVLKIEGDWFLIYLMVMMEDLLLVMFIIIFICLFIRYGVVKIWFLFFYNNVVSFMKGLNNFGVDEGSIFCDFVIRYYLVKKFFFDENV